ncbi:molybdate ABC transporter substrate-binding protein [Brevundimonas sp. AJA228-03]|uniref:molybdate ABC transporter substrate-binding protein n=1 Tax=Brevundimonas sp. AJA228-03 TaxID=2752515 RepID=UPI001FD7289F
MTALSARFTDRTGRPTRTVFAGSGDVARQVLSGAPADLLVLADTEWMDRLATANVLRPGSRVDLATNSLVVIAPADRPPSTFAWQGRIAIGDPGSVPAGRYARQMMQALGVWDGGDMTLITAADVRAVRGFVARGEVDLGVVYRSDALGYDAVRVVATPPPDVQPRIVYPAALTTRAAEGAAGLMQFLAGAEARETFARHGFGAVS